MKINAKLISSFGTVLVTTLIVFGCICYYTFNESAHKTTDKIITLQSSEIIYHATKTFKKAISGIEQQLASHLVSNACSLSSGDEIRALFEGFAKQSPIFREVSLYLYRSGATPPEFRTWLEESERENLEPFFVKQDKELFLLWPTQTPQGRACFVIKLDQAQLAATLRSYLVNSGYLNIHGAAILLTDKGEFLVEPIQQDENNPLPPDVLTPLSTVAPIEHVEQRGAVFVYRPPDTLFNAELTLVVPTAFNQEDLYTLKNRIIAAMLIVSWVSIWVMLIIAYKIADPIRKLSAVTKDIIAFNYTTELEIQPSNDEIGELAANFETMRHKIKELVSNDPLTKVYNRRFMMHLFDLEVSKALRQGTPLCCIMMDVDHFKKINDTHGHQVGDVALVEVGKTLLEISRSYDTPARYGGEEFLFLLPDTSINDATAIAERIRLAIKQLVIPVGEKVIRCTMSLGVAELDAALADTRDKIIHNADHALYQAKDNGRDQVVVYQRPEAQAAMPPAGLEP